MHSPFSTFLFLSLGSASFSLPLIFCLVSSVLTVFSVTMFSSFFVSSCSCSSFANSFSLNFFSTNRSLCLSVCVLALLLFGCVVCGCLDVYLCVCVCVPDSELGAAVGGHWTVAGQCHENDPGTGSLNCCQHSYHISQTMAYLLHSYILFILTASFTLRSFQSAMSQTKRNNAV